MKKISILFFCLNSIFINAQNKSTFEIKEGNFVLNNQPIQIYSGEMHFARVPRDYWRHRLSLLKAMGLNTVATYVFWNYHETSPGVWDFKSESRDIHEFIKIAGELGLYVILRPGPYSCAEWEFGGYPWWLPLNKNLEVRTYNQPFLDSCKTYFSHLYAQLKDLQVSRGGPILMIQAENEFGSYAVQRTDIPLETHKKYNAAIKDIIREVGFDIPMFTSDGSSLFEGGSIPGVLPTCNGEDDTAEVRKQVSKYHNNQGPYFVAEFYPGWLDHWGEPFQKTPTATVVSQMEKYFKAKIGFNFYMVHGGTNFGFTSGANYDDTHPIQPDITSYDYDAPISEAGWVTEKYIALRNLLIKNVDYTVPEIPKENPAIAIKNIALDKTVNVLSLKDKLPQITNDTPLTFEDLQQGHGYVLYSKRFTHPISGKLIIKGIRDFATVYINNKKVGELNRQSNKYELDIDIPFNATLDILVEDMGRINYGAEIIHNSKGIISPVMINGKEITGGWKMYKMPFETAPQDLGASNKNSIGLPTIYTGSFKLTETGDTFMDMEGWGKGIVFVNGHHLGRYWKMGPQQTLYLPGCWLKKGLNTISIFEQLNEKIQTSISALKTPILDKLKLDEALK